MMMIIIIMTNITIVMKSLSTHFTCRYSPGDIVVTENGVDIPGEAGLGLPAVLKDTFRIDYYKGYIQAAADAGVSALL